MKRIATAFMAALIGASSLVSAPAMAAPGDQSNRGRSAAYRNEDQRNLSGRDNGARTDDRNDRGNWSGDQNKGRYNNDGRYNDRRAERDWRHDERNDRYSDRDWRRGDRLSAYDRRHFRPVSYRDHYRDAPRGYRYERNDRGDVLLIGIATGIIAGVILNGD